MMQWHFVTSAEYAAGVKVAEDLYFLSDTLEIYRGETSYSQAIRLYKTTKPTAPALNVLYVDQDTLEGSTWNGTAWTTVLKAVSDTVTVDGTGPVSGKAVVAYVTEQLSSGTTSANIVKNVTYDSTEHLVTVTKADDTASTFVLNGLGCSLVFVNDATTGRGNIQLTDASGNAIGDAINLDLERFVKDAHYDAATKKIVMSFNDTTTILTGSYTYPDNMPTGAEVVAGVYVQIGDKWYTYDGTAWAETATAPKLPLEIDVGDLVDTYTVESTSGINLTMVANKITATLKISAEAGNAAVLKADGLFVPEVDTANLMSKVPGATDGNIATLDASGQIVDSGKAISDIGKPTLFSGASIDAAVGGATPKAGDFCIVAVQIGTSDKYERTAYIYENNAWVAMDGNYNAENVYFSSDLVTTSAIGNITLSNGQATIPAAGKNLAQVWQTIFVKEKNPSINQPSVSISAPQNKAYEVGTTVTPTFTATLNAGSYQYGPATGITATSWAISDTASHSASANTGSFDALVVDDTTSYRITATATYADGAIPLTNVGNQYTAGQIKAGSKSATSGAITGYRRGFYGTLTDKTGTVNSTLVRSLAGKTTATPVAGNVWNLSVPVGAVRVVFAYPATVRDVNSVLDVNGMNAEIKTAFTMSTVDVEGANGHTAKSYKVYVMDFAAPNDTANTYKITL